MDFGRDPSDYTLSPVFPQTKGEEIDSLLYGVADVARHMDRGQARELEQKTAELRSQWSNLQHVIGRWIRLRAAVPVEQSATCDR